MIQIITTTLRSDKTVKSTGTVLPAGTVVIAGIKRLAGTAAERAERTAMLEGVLDACVGRLSRLRRDDPAKTAAKAAVRIARDNLRRHDAGVTYKSTELLAILGGVHPTVTLDRAERGFLLQQLRGLVVESDLA